MQTPTHANGSAPDISAALRHARLVDAVLSRLQARQGLKSLANEIYSGLEAATRPAMKTLGRASAYAARR